MNTYGNGTQANQNRAHRNDIQWIKTKGNRFDVAGQQYISEYLNPCTGGAIRQHIGTGQRDGAWFVFDESGDVVETIESLTWAKAAAAVKMGA